MGPYEENDYDNPMPTDINGISVDMGQGSGNEKGNSMNWLNIVGNIFGAAGQAMTGIAAGNGAQNNGQQQGVPVTVGVGDSTKKWLTIGGIVGGALLLIIVLVSVIGKRR